ncbi:helix-turn-helix transcriptional regulator [Halopiger djelfimassiliensis]|uniref:helix-turn-helix transcriptional regulator n=1 Tax=Halopiger djelfimassiliensis TaxID=1293047 RepID=UPI00067818E1|nr:transcriptional regulator [Halopiger djelfimassiliensis]
MRSPSPNLDVIRTVSRRQPLLEALEDGPRHKRDLVERLDCSRSTVDRAIRELEWLAFVQRRDDGYRLTAAGRVALSEYRRSAGALDSIDEVSDLLADLPRDAPMSTALLEGARTTEPKPHAPFKPLERLVDGIDAADRIRGFFAAERLPRIRLRLYERTVEGTLDVEAVFTEALAAFLREEYPEQVREFITEGEFDMYVVDSVPYELAIVETETGAHVFVFVLNDRAEIEGVIKNDSQAALEWAEEVYQRFRADATALSPPDPSE